MGRRLRIRKKKKGQYYLEYKNNIYGHFIWEKKNHNFPIYILALQWNWINARACLSGKKNIYIEMYKIAIIFFFRMRVDEPESLLLKSKTDVTQLRYEE